MQLRDLPGVPKEFFVALDGAEGEIMFIGWVRSMIAHRFFQNLPRLQKQKL
jgi:hypothetical protein